ncbi:MAG: response regulator transcription factor [Chloroflexi bacterium]|jgi:two-component system KDP operon response regulator KdpE|nr:MAG: response regulator transcription factor [Chloroflexota bacterium]
MGHAKQRILLVDDDPGIMVAVKQALSTHGYQMTTATDGKEALDSFDREPPELILLDLVMPQCSGLEVCKRIREYSATPIIILSVKGSEADIVSVLDLGADDYLVKPFRLAELIARIRAVLRRGSTMVAAKVVCGDLEIDTEMHKVSVAGRVITLTPIEYALLAELAGNVGRVLTTRLLVQRVWGSQYSDANDYVKGVVRRLRVKLEPDPAHPRYIITEPHLGYRLSDYLS